MTPVNGNPPERPAQLCGVPPESRPPTTRSCHSQTPQLSQEAKHAARQQQTCQSCYTLTHTHTAVDQTESLPPCLPLTVGRILRSDGKCAQQRFDQQVSHRQHATRSVKTSEFLSCPGGLPNSFSSLGNATPRRVTELLNLVRGARTQGDKLRRSSFGRSSH